MSNAPENDPRKQRLAEALRQNLRRRKAQARESAPAVKESDAPGN